MMVPYKILRQGICACFCLLVISGCNTKTQEEKPPTALPSAAHGSARNFTLPNGTQIRLEEGALQKEIIQLFSEESHTDNWLVLDKILFKPGSSQMNRNDAETQLNDLATVFAAYPTRQIALGGFVGQEEASRDDLALNRAQATLNALVEFGVDVSRIAISAIDMPNTADPNKKFSEGVALRVQQN